MTAGQALRPDLMLAYLRVDRHRRLCAQRGADRRAASPVRAGGADRGLRDERVGLACWKSFHADRARPCLGRDRRPEAGLACLSADAAARLECSCPWLRAIGPAGRNCMGTIRHMLGGWLVASLLGVGTRRAGRLLARRAGLYRADAGISEASAGLGRYPGRDCDVRPDPARWRSA